MWKNCTQMIKCTGPMDWLEYTWLILTSFGMSGMVLLDNINPGLINPLSVSLRGSTPKTDDLLFKMRSPPNETDRGFINPG